MSHGVPDIVVKIDSVNHWRNHQYYLHEFSRTVNWFSDNICWFRIMEHSKVVVNRTTVMLFVLDNGEHVRFVLLHESWLYVTNIVTVLVSMEWYVATRELAHWLKFANHFRNQNQDQKIVLFYLVQVLKLVILSPLRANLIKILLILVTSIPVKEKQRADIFVIVWKQLCTDQYFITKINNINETNTIYHISTENLC